MANIAGYRAVIEAAHAFGRFFTGQVTAAARCRRRRCWSSAPAWPGWRRSARRAAWARSCAPPTRGPRSPTRSVAGRGVPVDRVAGGRGQRRRLRQGDGRRLQGRARRELYAEQAADVDIIITTALIPGRPAPRLITAEMVASMKPGSVIVDMAAGQRRQRRGHGRRTRSIVTANGVTIIGYTDLAGRLPAQASPALRHQPGQPAEAADPGQGRRSSSLDFDDVVQRVDDRGARRRDDLAAAAGAGLGRAGRRAAAAARSSRAGRSSRRPPARRLGAGRRRPRRCCSCSPRSRRPRCIGHFTVFALAIVIGYYVIGNVHHALHTPLMSVTNAISGIIVVGALLQIGHGDARGHARWRPSAILLASINVFGGFAVTRRMLGHVLEELSDHDRSRPPPAAAYIVAALLFILAPGRAVQARDGHGRQHVRHRRHGHRPGRHHRAGARPRHHRRSAWRC